MYVVVEHTLRVSVDCVRLVICDPDPRYNLRLSKTPRTKLP